MLVESAPDLQVTTERHGTETRFSLGESIPPYPGRQICGGARSTQSTQTQPHQQADFSQALTWNSLCQLTSVTTNGVTVSYGYDRMGKRVRRRVNGVDTVLTFFLLTWPSRFAPP